MYICTTPCIHFTNICRELSKFLVCHWSMLSQTCSEVRSTTIWSLPPPPPPPSTKILNEGLSRVKCVVKSKASQSRRPPPGSNKLTWPQMEYDEKTLYFTHRQLQKVHYVRSSSSSKFWQWVDESDCIVYPVHLLESDMLLLAYAIINAAFTSLRNSLPWSLLWVGRPSIKNSYRNE